LRSSPTQDGEAPAAAPARTVLYRPVMSNVKPAGVIPEWVPLLGGKYLLGDCIGAGGMGRVYRAHQPGLDRPVAIKILHRALADDPRIARHFRIEAIAASRFSHPNSVAVIDYGETDEGVPFLVMEYLDGRTLSQIVEQESPLDVGRAVSLAIQILRALGEAHLLGIVHADVKSDNVLVCETSGRGEQAKLVDFGLARIAFQGGEDCAASDAFISGTPDYMAPEIIRGAPPSPASDCYSVGAMLYELLTGGTPFGGADVPEIMRRHLEDVVVPPSLRGPDLAIPRHVEEAVLRALDKNPRGRFPSSEAFIAALAAATTPALVHRSHHASTRPPGHAVTTKVLPGPGASPAGGPRLGPNLRAVAVTEMTARRAVGDAIIVGEPGPIARRYIALARLLDSTGHPRAAATELEEALDVVCGNATPCPITEPAAEILTAMLAIYVELGDRVAAARARSRLDRISTLTMARP
jgi:serine/threonine protein kinase